MLGWSVLVVWFSLCVPEVQAQSIDRALVTSDSGWVDFGDPGDVFDFAPGGGRTFAFWVRSELTRFHIKLLDKRYKRAQTFSTRQWGYSFFLHQFTGTVGFYLSVPLEGDASTVRKNGYYLMGGAGFSVVADGTWHHVALVQDGQWVHVYVDAKLDFSYEAPAPMAEIVTENPLWFGWNDRDTIVYEGELDEMSVWGRALSASEIRDLAYGYPEPADPDLLAYWSFDGEDPDIAADSSPNGYDGRIYHAQRVASSRPLSPPFRDTIWYPISLVLAVVLAVAAVSWLSATRLRARNRQLEAQVAERTEEIRQQAEQLKSLDETKSRFFTNVSHEFRTPLTLTIGPLEDLKRGHHGPLPADVRGPIHQVLLSSRRLLRLVNQLLDVAKIEAHQLHLNRQPLDLAAYLRVLADVFVPLAQRKAITFQQSIPAKSVPVSADPEHLEKVFTNLLSNAFKFTPEGGRIGLALMLAEETVTVVVRDNGPGIPSDELPHIFDRFHRASSPETTVQVGTGIGLALAKELVELHEGEIKVESEAGFGAAFTVVLPQLAWSGDGMPEVETPPAATVPDELAPITTDDEVVDDDASGGPTVLVVDDNADIRRYVRSHLEPAYQVVEAVNGADGLAQARTVLPDLILSDVMMPEMDGYELCRAVKTDAELDFIPVILLTAKASSASKLEGLSEGADDYLTKPFSSEELRARVENLIHQRHRLRERFMTALPTEKRDVQADAESKAGESSVRSADAAWAEQLRATINAHLADEAFAVDALADAMGMARAPLYRRTQEVLALTPAAYLWQLRVERGAQLLVSGAGTVSEVAYGVGFKSVQHFARRFRAAYGVTPSQYARTQAAMSGDA
ncbi:MAG: hypothetical protein RhofKO_14110 [Rhodothermales bacterium]